MDAAKLSKNKELDKEYLAQFNIVQLEDVPRELIDRYLMIEKGGACVSHDDPLFAVYSKYAAVQALNAGCEPQLLILKNRSNNKEVLEAVREDYPQLPVCIVGDKERREGEVFRYSFDMLAVSAIFKRKALPEIPDILASSEKVVIFRGFTSDEEDLQSLGPQLRSAAAFFADAALLEKGAVDPYNSRLSRITIGSHFSIPFALYESDEALSGALASHGFETILLAASKTEGAVPLGEFTPKSRRIALVIDNGIQKGQDPDPALCYDVSVYVPGRPFDGLPLRLSSVAFYKLFSGESSS